MSRWINRDYYTSTFDVDEKAIVRSVGLMAYIAVMQLVIEAGIQL